MPAGRGLVGESFDEPSGWEEADLPGGYYVHMNDMARLYGDPDWFDEPLDERLRAIDVQRLLR